MSKLFTPEQVDIILEKSNVRFLNAIFDASGAEVKIPHGLKRVPRKWVVAKQSKAAVVYGTDDAVYLKLKADFSGGEPLRVVLEVV